MKKLEAFISNEPFYEGRTPKGKPGENETFDGKQSKDVVELNPKTDDSVVDETNPMPDELEENALLIQERLEMENPFFILGHAGWAKSTIVKKVAKKYGYEIIVVNLDKACREDLMGMPAPTKDEKGRRTIMYHPFPWQAKILYNPERKFLLFFDEMNQADPRVMNALMPIVQDHTLCGQEDVMNYLACGAGNYKSENKAVHSLSGPLWSRFKPIIIWHDNDEQSWDNQFAWYHKEYDKIFGEKWVSKWREFTPLFDNPREMDGKIWNRFQLIKKKGVENAGRWSVDRIAKYICGRQEDGTDSILKQDIDFRDRQKFSNEMAELIYEWLHREDGTDLGDGSASAKRGRRAGAKDALPIDGKLKTTIEEAIRIGYISGENIPEAYWPNGHHATLNKNILIAITEENIFDIWDPAEINAETLKLLIKRMKNNGIDFKYKTVEEAIKKHNSGSHSSIMVDINDEDSVMSALKKQK